MKTTFFPGVAIHFSALSMVSHATVDWTDCRTEQQRATLDASEGTIFPASNRLGQPLIAAAAYDCSGRPLDKRHNIFASASSIRVWTR
jgi:hypothetical protein